MKVITSKIFKGKKMFLIDDENYQDGGAVDSVLNSNKHLEWVKRLYDKNPKTLTLPGEKNPSTHYMESSDNLVYPTIIQTDDGKLKYLGDKARDYAIKNKTYIEFPTEQEAIEFGKNYKTGTGVLSTFQDGGVIEDNQGQWKYPGQITKINSNNITMKGVPYPVYGVSDIGDKQMMYPNGEYKFKGNSVTEYPILAQAGTTVKTYTPEEIKKYRDFVSNYKISSDPTFDKSEISQEINAAIPGTLCINGICSLVQKGGLTFSNPQTNDKRYISNIQFSDAVKKDKEDWYKLSNYGLKDYTSGDIVQFKDNTNKVPHHAELIRKNSDNTYTLIDNGGGQDWRETSYTKESLDNLMNSDMIQVMRPGYKNDYDYLMKLKQSNKSQVNNISVKYNDNLKYAYIYRTSQEEDALNEEARKKNIAYVPIPKNKNKYSEVVFNKLNDESYIKNIAKTYNISNQDAQDIIKYSYGIIKQETNFSPRSSPEGAAEYLLSKFRPKTDLNKKYEIDPSSGYAQIKFNNLTSDQKIKYNIRKPEDLYDYNKSQAILEDIVAKNYKYILNNFDKIKAIHPSLTKENALKFALYMQNTPQMIMNSKYLDTLIEKSIKNGYISAKDTPIGKNINIEGKSKDDIKKMLQLNLDKGSYPVKVMNYSNEIFQPAEIIRNSKKQFGGTVKVLNTKVVNGQKQYLINE
jgi:hypothetical protein